MAADLKVSELASRYEFVGAQVDIDGAASSC
jgi:hypothetical protein